MKVVIVLSNMKSPHSLTRSHSQLILHLISSIEVETVGRELQHISSPHFPTHAHWCSCMLSSSCHSDGLLLPLLPHLVHWSHVLSSTPEYWSCGYTFPNIEIPPFSRLLTSPIFKKHVHFLNRVEKQFFRFVSSLLNLLFSL